MKNAVRLYNGSAWAAIDDFQFDAWKYVRVVADVSKSTFDYYVGDDRDMALESTPKNRNLHFVKLQRILLRSGLCSMFIPQSHKDL